MSNYWIIIRYVLCPLSCPHGISFSISPAVRPAALPIELSANLREVVRCPDKEMTLTIKNLLGHKMGI